VSEFEFFTCTNEYTKMTMELVRLVCLSEEAEICRIKHVLQRLNIGNLIWNWKRFNLCPLAIFITHASITLV